MYWGDKLVVDLTSGISRVESGKNGQGRVQGLFQPGSGGSGADSKTGGAAPKPHGYSPRPFLSRYRRRPSAPQHFGIG